MITEKYSQQIWILLTESFSSVVSDLSQPFLFVGNLIICRLVLDVQSSCTYKDDYNIEANNFEMDVSTRRLILSMYGVFILRAIMHFHNLPLETVIMLWSSFYALIMRSLIHTRHFISSTILWNQIQQLHYIDGALNTANFKPFITQRSHNGFR